MKYAKLHNGDNALINRIESELTVELANHGYFQAPFAEPDIRFILNFTELEHPRAVHRREQNEFVVSIAVLENEADDLRYLAYNTLIRTLSNLVILIKPAGENAAEVYCITPEVGFYHFPYAPDQLYRAMAPIIEAHFVIDNKVFYDLPEKYLQTPVVQELKHHGTALDELGVLPAPFPMKEVLSEENIEHVYKLFRINGLSYGNLSARAQVPEFGRNTFWMTARGADKAHLKGVGQDILLVEGYEETSGNIIVHQPPDGNKRIRVSVDAIEHLLIYQTFPAVGAIVHVHAWMQGIHCTRQNYPCGTIELAREVVHLLKTTPSPSRAVIGLKNHGLTITGPNLEDIFSRISGKLLKEVPMMP
jgi:ribulose-5-phosphate 4-epimerase/fuculose-1-phosphate aldolase